MKVGLILVVNVHGAINSSAPVRKALEELKVVRKFSATVVTDDGPTMGMLKLCKDHTAWSPVDKDFLASLLKKRGMVSSARTLDGAALKELGFKKHEELAAKMVKEDLRLSAVSGIRPFFRLAPPKGGFKQSMRRQYTERGMLGSNPKLLEIVERMV
jgi:large subunit ribosomal protein L30